MSMKDGLKSVYSGNMSATVTKWTTSCTDKESEDMLTNMKVASGSSAGICYSNKGYFDCYVTDYEKALKRFETVIGTGHHSISDHTHITMYFENIPKIVAMQLNNLNVYATSEKSGRYTEMKGIGDLDTEKYTKWVEKLKAIIRCHEEALEDKLVEKLAMENARYMLSVFSPVSMEYTASLRQWNYILQFMENKSEENHSKEQAFFEELNGSFQKVLNMVSPLINIPNLREFKGNIENYNMFSDNVSEIQKNLNTVFKTANLYETTYLGTFVQLAQIQRHRSLNYTACIFNNSGTNKENFYIPPIIENTNEESEWISDMKEVIDSDLFPQGRLVCIHESGLIRDFELKAKERMCARVQLETMYQTRKLYSKIYGVELLDVPMKAELVGGCKEICHWKCSGGKHKLV